MDTYIGYLPGSPSFQAEVTQTNPRDNLVSTVDTINKMMGLVNESVGSPIVVEAATEIVQGIGKDRPSELDLVRAVFWWVKHHVTFKEDEYTVTQDLGLDLGTGKELLISPMYLLAMSNPMGDCDDYSTLIATLLKQLGFRQVGFRTIAADHNDTRMFTHVYVVVQLEMGSLFPLDGSHGSYPGWEAETIYKLRDWWI